MFIVLKDIYEPIRPIWYVSMLLLFLLLLLFLFWKIWKQRKTVSTVPSSSDFLNLYANKIKGYKKTIILEKDRLLLLSEYGFYLFYFYPEEGILTGKYADDFVIRKPDNVPLRNPFLVLKQEQERLFAIRKIDCKKVLILKETCHFGITDYQDEMLIREKNIIAKIENNMGQRRIYKQEEIDTLYNLYNVNLCQNKANNLQ